MSDVAVAHASVHPAETPLTPESWGKLGMWLFLAGDAMSFGGLIVGYGILRHASKNWPVPAQVLGINLTAFMTFLLIVSSVWMVLGLSAIQEIRCTTVKCEQVKVDFHFLFICCAFAVADFQHCVVVVHFPSCFLTVMR